MASVKLFLSGPCGRLGRAVLIEALAKGWDVTGIDPVVWPDPDGPPRGAVLHQGTLDDGALLDRALEGVTHVVHTAGLHGENLADRKLADFLRSNVEDVAGLVTRCAEKNIRHFCLSSTMEVLVGRDYGASGAALLDEDSPIRADSPYSASKAAMERLAADMARQLDLSISVLRYMAFGYRKDTRLGLGLLSRSLSASDAARATILAVQANGMKGEIFNIGPKSPLTNSDITRALKDPAAVLERHFPGSAAIIEQAGHQIVPELFWPVTSIEKARRLLGWEPRYSFETWLEDHGWSRPS